MVKAYPLELRHLTSAPSPSLLMYYLEGVCFYHRVSQGVPFYHSSVVEKLLTLGLYHRSRTLPGMMRFGGDPAGPGNRKRPKRAYM